MLLSLPWTVQLDNHFFIFSPGMFKETFSITTNVLYSKILKDLYLNNCALQEVFKNVLVVHGIICKALAFKTENLCLPNISLFVEKSLPAQYSDSLVFLLSSSKDKPIICEVVLEHCKFVR